MAFFNPFPNFPAEPLTVDDLEKLIAEEVSEGYVVEYKEDFPSNQKVGHGIAALANTYGGWFFVGIRTDSENRAAELVGFDRQQYKDPIDKIREVIKSHINPLPLFHPQLISLTPERAVLAVYVPDGQDTPFFTIDGRVYRRASDSSDPVLERDRHAIDQLVAGGRRSRQRFADFARDNRTFSEAESEDPWVSIYLSPYPDGSIPRRPLMLEESMSELLAASNEPMELFPDLPGVLGNIQLNTAQTTNQSVLLRQVTDPTRPNTVSVEYFTDGKARFCVPLSFVSGRQVLSVASDFHLEVSEALGEATNGSDDSDLSLLKLVDLSQLWLSVATLLTPYQRWLGGEHFGLMRVAVEFHGMWRVVPFLDSPVWAEHVRRFGLPVSQRAEFWSPENPADDGGYLRKFGDDSALWMAVSGILGLALGFPEARTAQLIGQAVAQAAAR